VPAAFGLSASSVSRRCIRGRALHLQTLCERRLDGDEFVAVVLDGKTFEPSIGVTSCSMMFSPSRDDATDHGNRLPQRMTARQHGNLGLVSCLFHRLLPDGFVKAVTTLFFRQRVTAMA
jgi:hypothetical protein